ncbi:hypothetical protein KIPB_007250, partial [Kipferlia bialata]|eukprot:g7250.t1
MSLDLSRTSLCDRSMSALSRLIGLRRLHVHTLSLGGASFTASGLLQMASILSSSGVHSLTLRYCTVPDADMARFLSLLCSGATQHSGSSRHANTSHGSVSSCLSRHEFRLTSLDLSGSVCGPLSSHQLTRLLREVDTLESVTLCGARLGHGADSQGVSPVDALLSAICDSSLSAVDISGVDLSGDHPLLETLVSMATLRRLTLSNTHITEGRGEVEGEGEGSLNLGYVGSGVVGACVQELNMARCGICDVATLPEGVQANSSLVRVNLRDNPLDTRSVTRLQRAAEGHLTLKVMSLSISGGSGMSQCTGGGDMGYARPDDIDTDAHPSSRSVYNTPSVGRYSRSASVSVSAPRYSAEPPSRSPSSLPMPCGTAPAAMSSLPVFPSYDLFSAVDGLTGRGDVSTVGRSRSRGRSMGRMGGAVGSFHSPSGRICASPAVVQGPMQGSLPPTPGHPDPRRSVSVSHSGYLGSEAGDSAYRSPSPYTGPSHSLQSMHLEGGQPPYATSRSYTSGGTVMSADTMYDRYLSQYAESARARRTMAEAMRPPPTHSPSPSLAHHRGLGVQSHPKTSTNVPQYRNGEAVFSLSKTQLGDLLAQQKREILAEVERERGKAEERERQERARDRRSLTPNPPDVSVSRSPYSTNVLREREASPSRGTPVPPKRVSDGTLTLTVQGGARQPKRSTPPPSIPSHSASATSVYSAYSEGGGEREREAAERQTAAARARLVPNRSNPPRGRGVPRQTQRHVVDQHPGTSLLASMAQTLRDQQALEGSEGSGGSEVGGVSSPLSSGAASPTVTPSWMYMPLSNANTSRIERCVSRRKAEFCLKHRFGVAGNEFTRLIAVVSPASVSLFHRKAFKGKGKLYQTLPLRDMALIDIDHAQRFLVVSGQRELLISAHKREKLLLMRTLLSFIHHFSQGASEVGGDGRDVSQYMAYESSMEGTATETSMSHSYA